MPLASPVLEKLRSWLSRELPVSVLVVAGVSFVLRLAYAPFVEFGWDSREIYALGARVYFDGDVSTTGARIVYSGTRLPGSLQALLAALPLPLSGGEPWGEMLFMALLNFLSALLLFRVYRRVFPRFQPGALALLTMVAPWTILFTTFWNPSYLPLIACAFLLGLIRLFRDAGSFWGIFWVALCVPVILQLHMSFVVFAAIAVGALWMGWPTRPNWGGLVAGAILGSVTLLPRLLEVMNAPADPGGKGFLLSNVVFRWARFLDLPGYFLRYFSFPTGETFRFLGLGSGFGGAVTVLNGAPWLWPLFVLGMAVSAGMIWMSLRFCFWDARNRSLFMDALLRRRALSPDEKLRLTVFVTPLLTGFLFLFSIKAPSAHTFWSLMPFSFYPVLLGIQEGRLGVWLGGGRATRGLAIYAAVALTYSVWGNLLCPRTDYATTHRLAEQHYPAVVPEVEKSRYRDGVRVIYWAKDRRAGIVRRPLRPGKPELRY
ncbi:MAG: hypothetical protein IT285_04960 [Bdellovibrionales bacterium]|nr:hypothetical protein [Bdellovibrionales bacterium]